MTYFLTSNIGGYKKVNGNKFADKFNEDNYFVENLKNSIKNYDKFVVVASDPLSYDYNDLFLKIYKEALELTGIKFEEYILLDNRNKDKIKEIIDNSSLIILSGGDTYVEHLFFEEINLRKYLKNYNACIVGISAGSINMAADVYDSPEKEEDLKRPCSFNGLGLTEIRVEPHFVYEDSLFDEMEKLQRKHLLNESNRKKVIGILDGSYIMIENDIPRLYGDAYLIENGEIKKLERL